MPFENRIASANLPRHDAPTRYPWRIDRPLHRQTAPLAGLLVMSGAAALIYQVVWARLLALALGATARGVAAVLATTMLGLAIGALAIGRLGDRARRPLALYGALEIAIAACALTATALAARLGSLHRHVEAPFVVFAGLMLLLGPTALMGATLPMVLAHVDRARSRAQAASRAVGRLYAANTFGALLGAAAAGFVLIERFGLWGAASVAAALNVAAGILAIGLERATRAPAGASPPVDGVGQNPRARPPLHAWLAAFVSGLVALGYEVVYTRLLVQGFLGTAYAFTIILAGFLGGLALGAALAPRGEAGGRGALGAVLAVGGVLALAFAPLVAMTPEVVERLRGSNVVFGVRLAIYAAVALAFVGLPAVVWGMAFPMAAARFVRDARAATTLGGAMLVNTLGGVAGSLAAGFVLLPRLGARGALIALAAVQALAGLAILAGDRAARRSTFALAAAVALALGVAWPPHAGSALGEGTPVPPFAVGREREFRVLCHREGETATTMVIEETRTGRKSLVLDGFVAAADGPGTQYMPMMGHLPMLAHAAPRRLLVIGFGTGATARAVASWPGVVVDIAEINPDVLACAPLFADENRRLVRRARLEDGRALLLRPGPAYDAITLEPMPPHFAGAVNLYAREYYALARERLTAGGMIVQWLPLHLVSPEDARQIVATVQSVFSETRVWLMPEDGTGLVLGARRPIDPSVVERRLASAPPAFRALGLGGASLRGAFALDPAGSALFGRGAALVTDDRPRLEYSGVDRVLWRFRNAQALRAYNLARIAEAARSARN